MKSTYILFINLLLSITLSLGAPTQPTISSYHTKKTFHEQIVSELERIEEHWNVTRGDDLGVAVFSTYWWFKPSSIDIDNIRIKAAFLNGRGLNYTSVWPGNDTFTVKMEGSQAFSLELEFDYSYSCYNKGSGTGVVYLQAFDTTINKVYTLSTGKYHTEINAKFTDMTLVKIESGPYKGDTHVTLLAGKALAGLIETNNDKRLLNKIFESELNNYYDIVDTLRATTSAFFNSERVKLVYEELAMPKIITPEESEEAIIFYYYADVLFDNNNNKYDDSHTINRTSAIWDSFIPNDGSFQIFISNDVLADLFNTISQDNRMNVTISNAAGIDLDIETVGRFFPSLLNDYPLDDPVTIHSTFNRYSVAAMHDHFEITTNLNTVIVNSLSKVLFESNSDYTFGMKYSLSDSNAVNMVLIKDSSVVSRTISATKGAFIQEEFNSFLSSILNSICNRHNFLLLQNDLETKTAFRQINQVLMRVGEGLLITGEPVIYSDPNVYSASGLLNLR